MMGSSKMACAPGSVVSSLLPFLYETRSILRTTTVPRAAYQATAIPRISRFAFSSCQKRSNIPWEDPDIVERTKGSGRQTSKGNGRSVVRRVYERTEVYQGSQPKARDEEPERFDEDEEDHIVLPAYSPKRPSKDSTLTPTEKEAFDRIFESIRAQKTAKFSEDGTDDFDILDTEDMSIGKNKTPIETLDEIMSGAIRRQQKPNPKRQGLQLDGTSFDNAQEKIKDAVQKYPPVLQGGAKKALNAAASTAALDLEASANETKKLDELRQPERDRVEKLMRGANTDVELWKVLEAEVFPMVARLGLEVKEDAPTTPKKKSRSNKAGKAKAVEQAVAEEKLAKIEPLDLNIYGPLYPTYLILALRLLDSSFSKPSPLILSLLPRIKSFGVLSHVLGTSTPFYNDLLRITYNRYDDCPGALDLLQEMDQLGLEFNAETKTTIDQMFESYIKMRKGNMGPTMEVLSRMPGWGGETVGKVKWWRRRIQTAIEEREAEIRQRLEWSS